MRFYHWYYKKNTNPLCYRLAIENETSIGHLGFMYYDGVLYIRDNMDNPTWLRDELFIEEDLPELNREVIKKLFTTIGII